MGKKLIQSVLLSGILLSVPATAMELLLSSSEGDTVTIHLQEAETFKLVRSRPLHAKTSMEFETMPQSWTGLYKKQGEQIVLWSEANELGRIHLWDQSGQIKAHQ